MNEETLSNHIRNLGKSDLNILVMLLMKEYWHKVGVNVDGANDGGADFVEYDAEGMRNAVVYQLTTQKTQVEAKVYRDAKKTIDKLGAKRFYFITTIPFSMVKKQELEEEIFEELGISISVLTPDVLAGFLTSKNLVPMFLSAIHANELVDINRSSVDYRNMALYGYTILSKDAKNLKTHIYDDALLMVLAETSGSLEKSIVVERAMKLISISESKQDTLLRRIDGLMVKGLLEKDKEIHENNKFFVRLNEQVRADIEARKVLYSLQVDAFSGSLEDLMLEYGKSWTKEDSRKASVWIASAYISKRLSVLQKADAELSESFLKVFNESGISNLRTHLLKRKNVAPNQLYEIEEKMLSIAANHPLIEKLTQAAVYLALEGTNPLSASKVLGAFRWSDVYLMVEPTIGIPLLCSYFFKGNVSRMFDNSICAASRAKELGVRLRIPYIYIDECAGHLLMARRFDGLNLKPEEMQYSSNAFVANYYRLKLSGIEVPDSFMDYLKMFSPAVQTIHADVKNWKREIITTLQSYFTQHGVCFEDIPRYEDSRLKDGKDIYITHLDSLGKTKSNHLIKNDVVALHYINERVSQTGEHWMLLTHDRTLVSVARKMQNLAWTATPTDFLDMTAMSAENSESRVYSVMHVVANLSERSLAIGARILDNIILYASDKMQDWQFKEKVEIFKTELVEEYSNMENEDIYDLVDKKTEKFLQEHGAPFDLDEEYIVDIENSEE